MVEKANQAVVVRDMDGYQEMAACLDRRIGQLQAELDSLRADSAQAGAELRRRIADCKAEISRISGIAGKRSAYEYALGRIDELRRDAQTAADNLGQVEKLLFAAEEYSRYKAGFVESSVNDRFRLARFRLFREQANGGVEDRCDVVYDGIPYLGLNNGMKINVGIDIINTLSRAYGVTVPLFVDNAESVTKLEKATGQVIRLVVSENDKELRLSHEN